MTLVQRLREAGSTGLDLSPGDPLCIEAADEIERLEREIQEITDHLRWLADDLIGARKE